MPFNADIFGEIAEGKNSVEWNEYLFSIMFDFIDKDLVKVEDFAYLHSPPLLVKIYLIQ